MTFKIKKCMNIVMNNKRGSVFIYEVLVFFRNLSYFLEASHQCFGGTYLQMAVVGFSKPSVTCYRTVCNHIFREFHGQLQDCCLHEVNVH
jgi:hypothetical protein